MSNWVLMISSNAREPKSIENVPQVGGANVSLDRTFTTASNWRGEGERPSNGGTKAETGQRSALATIPQMLA